MNSTKAIFQPRKRTDLNDLLDKIMALKNAIKFKLEIQKQIKLQSRMILALEQKTIWNRLLSIFWSNAQKIKRLNREIEISKLLTTNENCEKQTRVYHKNELLLEDELTDVYKEMDERYDYYLSQLENLYETVRWGAPNDSDLPDMDIKKLMAKFQSEPPADKIEKLTFYLTMEELLTRSTNH